MSEITTRVPPERGRLFYVTGIPGTRVEASLHKYGKWLGVRKLPSPHIIKLETLLREHATTAVRDSLRANIAPNSTPHLLDVLELPKRLLYDCWRRAFTDALSQAAKVLKTGRDVILTFHACWYHIKNREYVTALDMHHFVQPDAKATSLITLIDDIYDVRSTLSDPGELFHAQLFPEEIVDIVFKLLLILEWRSNEIMLSERVASLAAGGRHFVLATKHPILTLHDLLNTSKPAVYLSHHIAEPRRMMIRSQGDAERATSFRDELRTLSSRLRGFSTLFEPTSIDELRFDYTYTTESLRELLIPKLGKRWPLGEHETELLFKPPKRRPAFGNWETKADRLLRIASQDNQTAETRTELARLTNELEACSALLNVLRETIVRQINSRDHFLVEHSDGIVAYRPYLFGHEAGGVKEELEHHARLMRGDPSAVAWVVALHTPDDEIQRPKQIAIDVLQEWRETGLITGDDAMFRKLKEEMLTDDDFWAYIRDADKLAPDEIFNKLIADFFEPLGLKLKPPDRAGAMGAEPAAFVRDIAQEKGREFFAKTKVNYLHSDLASFSTTEIIAEQLNAEAFADRVRDAIPHLHRSSTKVSAG